MTNTCTHLSYHTGSQAPVYGAPGPREAVNRQGNGEPDPAPAFKKVATAFGPKTTTHPGTGVGTARGEPTIPECMGRIALTQEAAKEALWREVEMRKAKDDHQRNDRVMAAKIEQVTMALRRENRREQENRELAARYRKERNNTEAERDAAVEERDRACKERDRAREISKGRTDGHTDTHEAVDPTKAGHTGEGTGKGGPTQEERDAKIAKARIEGK